MNIIDGLGQHTELLSVCLEDWSAEAKEAGSGRREWINRFRKKGLQVRLALDDHGKIGGMIQYLPVEASHVEGTGLYFILCVWVHGYKEGRGNHPGRAWPGYHRDEYPKNRSGMSFIPIPEVTFSCLRP